jgi:energy-coupling factor transporter ATP-binding protein EcfA2
VSALVYVHGTNGSGKSTLARAVLAAMGRSARCGTLQRARAKRSSHTAHRSNFLLGKYDNACGGWTGTVRLTVLDASARCAIWPTAAVFAEGLITPGVETCQRLAGMYTKATFIHLATPVEDCILNVLARRQRKGNDKPYDPANLYKKAQSAESWAARLKSNGWMSIHWTTALPTT